MARIDPEQLQLFASANGELDMAKLRGAIQRLKGVARASNTLRAYKADWEDFSGWCQAAGRPALPAEADTLMLYVAAQLEGRELKVSTLSRRLAAIAGVHRAEGRRSPVTPEVRELLTSARRERGSELECKRAITPEELRRVVRALPRTAVGVRDRAILLLGFAGGMRRSEVSSLDMADVRVTGKGLLVSIRRSKTDQEGKGRELGIFPGRHQATDPVAWVKRWLRVRGKAAGALFVRFDSGAGELDRLSDEGIAEVIKRSVALVGLDPGLYAGHSLRAGCATAALESGVPESLVMERTGHKSMAVFRQYVRPANVWRFNPLAKAL